MKRITIAAAILGAALATGAGAAQLRVAAQSDSPSNLFSVETALRHVRAGEL